MQLQRDTIGGNVIRSFSPGELRVNDRVLTDHLILTVNEIIQDWSPPAVQDMSIANFSAALERSPEVILFGTGSIQRFPPGSLMTEIMKQGIGFEVMDTGAACRTFNLLTAEGRAVVAALLLS